MSQLNLCVNCGSQDFEEEDGQLVCTQCGQQKEGLLQVVDDSGDFGTQGKVLRKKIEKTKVRYTKVYRGVKAYRLYLQAWQHILWKQAFALIHILKIAPPELWTVTRDLWTLTLSQLTARLDRDDSFTPSGKKDIDAVTNDADATDAQTGNSEVDAITTTTFSPSLWASISHIYISTLLLRLPISLAEIHSFILTDQIPFIRSIRHIPYEIVNRLPPEYHSLLDTLTIPTKTELQKAVSDLASTFHQDFHLIVPALNWKVMIFEWMKTLALPIEVYPASKRLADLLSFEFTYNFHTEEHPDNKAQKIKSRKTPVFWPEVQLISILVVATKLLFPFSLPSASSSHPTARLRDTKAPSSEFSSSMTLCWPIWLSLHQADRAVKSNPKVKPQQGPSSTGKELTIRDTDVFNMSDEAIDAYMDWYQGTFTTPDAILATKKTELEQSILNMFPLRSVQDREAAASINGDIARQKGKQEDKGQASRELSERVQAEAILPGQACVPASVAGSISTAATATDRRCYPIFSTVESVEATTSFFNAEVDENPVLFFHQLAADVACIDMKRLVIAVRYTEQRLEKVFREKNKNTHRKKRGEAFGGEESVEHDVVMD